MTAVVVAGEIGGGGFAAEVAVDALVIHIESAGDIFGIFVCVVSHSLVGNFGVPKIGANPGVATPFCVMWTGGPAASRLTRSRALARVAIL